ncbi:hypothetical protein VCHENC02_0774A, partial [Vibrio harveyi]
MRSLTNRFNPNSSF